MGTNPFDDEGDSSSSFGNESHRHGEKHNSFKKESIPSLPHQQQSPPLGFSKTKEPIANAGDIPELSQDPIWVARNVEWPIPTNLNSSTFNQLYKTSRSLLNTGTSDPSLVDFHTTTSNNPELLSDDGNQFNTGGYTNSIAGLMSRVLNNNPTSSSNISATQPSHIPSSDSLDTMNSTSSVTRGHRVLPPQPNCVAASNGWIVALSECPYGFHEKYDNLAMSHRTSSGLPRVGSISSPDEKVEHSVQNTLRIISRWNVYRGTMSTGSGIGKYPHSGAGLVGNKGEILFPLPHPLNSGSTQFKNNGATIAGIFVDPTGCHTFISAFNGEAYYLHSNSKRVLKLPGFGPGRKEVDRSGTILQGALPTGTNSSLNKSQAKRSIPSKFNSTNMGIGLKDNSYVTAVAWDKERGTEKSTKRILLGTNLGEIYEFSLCASDGDDISISPDKNSNVKPTSAEEDLKLPILLHVLGLATMQQSSNQAHSTSSHGPTPVSGLYFERIQGDVIILAVTSGNKKPTRLYSFRHRVTNMTTNISTTVNSAVSFQTVFSSLSFSEPPNTTKSIPSRSKLQQHATIVSSTDLVGSIDFADLKICQGAFAIRTETGIYFGSVDKVGSIFLDPPVASSNSASSQYDFGRISYSSSVSSQQSQFHNQNSSSKIPLSISLTPHHFISLSFDGIITFINRVSRKPVQREHIEWNSSMHSSAWEVNNLSASNSNFGFHVTSELMMDVRRPDQVWLRQGHILVHISSSQEDRDDWKYTLQRCLQGSKQKKNSTSDYTSMSTEEKLEDARFEIARSQCSNTTQKSVVGVARAEFHFERGRRDIAAKYFAQAPPVLSPFASTALRLSLPSLGVGIHESSNSSNNLNTNSNGPLITYLMDKFRLAAGRSDSVQCTMLGAWLVELYLHEKEREKNEHINNSSRTKYRSEIFFSAGNKSDVCSSSSSTTAHSSSMTSSLKHVKAPSLGSFLAGNFRYLDAQTTIRILASHDVKAVECAGYAAASGNIKTAVNAALSGDVGKTGAMDALRVLNDAPIEIAEPFYYKHACTLLSRAPMQSARSFLARYPHGLLPTKLLPAFMYYERRRAEMREQAAKMELEHGPLAVGKRSDQIPGHADGVNERNLNTSQLSHANLQIQGNVSTDASGVEISIDKGPSRRSFFNTDFVDDEKAVVKYLEGVIKLGCQSSAIYNYLISLYAAMDDEGPLFRFLSANMPTGSSGFSASMTSPSKAMDGISASPLDMAYTLRMVLKTGRHFRSAVKLYMGFGLRQQAVELALKVDPALARELARESIEKDERKRLWLMIARNAASDEHGKNKDVVAKVVSVIKDCGSDVLSIEDVLPFLPDFAQIDQFKDEICSALTSYSSKIEQYLKEMNECDQTCDALRAEISRLRSHDMELVSTARCALTHKLIMNEDEPFYVFPSGYVVLESPLKAEVSGYLNEEQNARLKNLELELETHKENVNGVTHSGELLEELQAEMDGLIAAECPFTASIMVDSIDKGFLSSLEEDQKYEHLFH